MEKITGLIISLLIACHVLGDFYLQTKELVKGKLSKDKSIRQKSLLIHSLQHFFVMGILVVPLFGARLVMPIIFVGASHYAIDRVKTTIQHKTDKSSLRIFILDQILHLLMILLIIPFIKDLDENSFTFFHKIISAQLVNGFPVLAQLDNDSWRIIISTISLYLFMVNGGTVVTKLCIEKVGESPVGQLKNSEVEGDSTVKEVAATREGVFRQTGGVDEKEELSLQQGGNDESETKKKRNLVGSLIESLKQSLKSIPYNLIKSKQYTGGEIIGILERILICTFVIHESYVPITAVITAKSIARYNKIVEDPNFSDKFLIGTLSSLLIAFMAGWIYKYII